MKPEVKGIARQRGGSASEPGDVVTRVLLCEVYHECFVCASQVCKTKINRLWYRTERVKRSQSL